MSKLYLGKPIPKDNAIETLKKEKENMEQELRRFVDKTTYTYKERLKLYKSISMAIQRLKEQKIDIEFEIKHYQAMINNPTPDVTEYDIHKAYIIIDFLRQFRAINYEKGRHELNKIKEYKEIAESEEG